MFTGLMNDNAMIDTVELAAKTVTTLWAAPKAIAADGMHVSVARNGTTSALVEQSFEQPPEIYTGQIGHWTPLTAENDALGPLVRLQSVTWQ